MRLGFSRSPGIQTPWFLVPNNGNKKVFVDKTTIFGSLGPSGEDSGFRAQRFRKSLWGFWNGLPSGAHGTGQLWSFAWTKESYCRV